MIHAFCQPSELNHLFPQSLRHTPRHRHYYRAEMLFPLLCAIIAAMETSTPPCSSGTTAPSSTSRAPPSYGNLRPKNMLAASTAVRFLRVCFPRGRSAPPVDPRLVPRRGRLPSTQGKRIDSGTAANEHRPINPPDPGVQLSHVGQRHRCSTWTERFVIRICSVYDWSVKTVSFSVSSGSADMARRTGSW